jgi:diguanylate cyclase (GGDEF)-like protein
VKIARSLRRAGKASFGALAGALACALIAAGAADGARGAVTGESPSRIGPALGVAAVAILVAVTVLRRLRFEAPSARAQRISFWLAIAPDLADVEVSLALVAGCYTAIAVTGGVDSPVYPLVYAVVAFAATLLTRAGAWSAIGGALLMEGALAARAPSFRGAAVPLATHVAFVAGAAAAHALMLRGLIQRHRRRRAIRLDRETAARRESARDYRLIASALGPASRAPRSRDDEEHLLAAGGVEMITDQAAWIVQSLKRSLDARTVALAWLDDDGERMKLKEILSDRDDVVLDPRLPSAGVLGAIARDRAPLVLAATKPGHIPYYIGGGDGAAFVGVPVLEGPHVRGVLCADRLTPFDERAKELLADACAQLLRAVQAEQVFRAVERAKYEHERFFQAAAMLGRALTPEQVMETAFDAAAAIVDYDISCITLYDKNAGKHRIAAVRTRGTPLIDPEKLANLEFKDNTGLAAMVVKNRHYLPAGGEVREVTAPVYTKKEKLEDARSLLVLPLVSADEAIGTLLLASRTEKKFGKDVREMLGVIATQVAVSLQNGLLYKQMETMATTDGLTGLTNHRTFQDRFGDLLERAGRHNYRAAVLLCDVDFFKKVNDNYGHPVGDEVLRRVARVLGEVARKIDIVARYGGEEFAVVLENVGLEQARQVGDRMRQEVGRLEIDSDKGRLKVTMSVGVAAFPDDARDRAQLIERADHALYHAKHSGRNQVVTYPEFVAARSKRAS